MIPMSLGSMAVSLYVDHTGINSGAAAATAKLQAFSRNLQMKGLSNILIGVSIAFPLKQALNEASEFEKQMRYITTVLDEPDKWIGKFTEDIKKMSMQFGESTATLSKGLYDILSAVIPPEEAMNLLTISAKSARAGMTDTATAIDSTVSMLKAYALSTEYAADISDWMFQVVRYGIVTYEELAQDIGFVATTASMAGVSLEEFGAAIATMTRVGLKGNHAIVSLYNILSEFLKPSQEAAETARSLGFEMSSATLKSKGLYWVFKQIKDLPPDIVAKLFPNIRGLRGVLPALQNMAGFEDDLKNMANRAGATQIAFDKMVKGRPLYLFMDRAAQAIKNLSRAIGDALGGPLTKMSDSILNAVNSISEFIKKHQWLIQVLGASAIALIASGTAMISLGIAGRVVGMALSGTISMLSGLGSIITFVLSPIGLLIVTLGLVAAAFVQVYGDGNTFFDKLGDIASRIVGWVQPAFEELKWVALGSFWAIEFGIEHFGKLAQWVLYGLGFEVVRFANQIWYFFTEVIPATLNWFLDNWKDVFTTAWNFLKTVFTNIVINAQNFERALWDFFAGDGFNFEWTGLLTGFENTVKELPKIAERVIGPLEADMAKQLSDLEGEIGRDWDQFMADKVKGMASSPAVDNAVEAAKKFERQLEPGTSPLMTDKPALPALVEKGSAEAYTSIVKNTMDPAKSTAKNTHDMVREQRETNRKLDGMAANAPTIYDAGLGVS